MARCANPAYVVAMVVELDCIFVNDDISVTKQVQRNLIDDIRFIIRHGHRIRGLRHEPWANYGPYKMERWKDGAPNLSRFDPSVPFFSFLPFSV